MRFTPTIAALVLAHATSIFAAPQLHRRQADAAPPEPPAGLSVTQQLFLSDLASDRFNILTKDEDFKFNLTPESVPAGRGGVIKAANRKTFPALVGTGASMAVGIIKPCGINTFHVHPRSAELQLVIKGQLVTEMVPENGVRPIRNTLNAFDMTPFYQGSIHHQFNPQCEDAVFVAAFAAEDFGTASVVNSIFELDEGALVDTFGGSFDGKMIEKIKGQLPASVVQGVQTCLAKCGGKGGDKDAGKDAVKEGEGSDHAE